jgi:hypothetical protein
VCCRQTHATGQLLREATHINKSLHFLELVIKTLAESKPGSAFVPYRNSMMTNVLRDSLGGNCKTVMIATINPEEAQTGVSAAHNPRASARRRCCRLTCECVCVCIGVCICVCVCLCVCVSVCAVPRRSPSPRAASRSVSRV